MSPFDNLGGGWEWSRAVRRWVGLSWVGSKHQPITQSLYPQLYCLPPSKYGNCNPNVLTIEVDASFKRLLLPMLGSLIWSSVLIGTRASVRNVYCLIVFALQLVHLYCPWDWCRYSITRTNNRFIMWFYMNIDNVLFKSETLSPTEVDTECYETY